LVAAVGPAKLWATRLRPPRHDLCPRLDG